MEHGAFINGFRREGSGWLPQDFPIAAGTSVAYLDGFATIGNPDDAVTAFRAGAVSIFADPFFVADQTGPRGVRTSLSSAVPNPASSVANVVLFLPEAADVRIDLYNAIGQRVRETRHESAAAGPLDLRVDVQNLAPGVYILRARTVTGTSSNTMSQLLTVVR